MVESASQTHVVGQPSRGPLLTPERRGLLGLGILGLATAGVSLFIVRWDSGAARRPAFAAAPVVAAATPARAASSVPTAPPVAAPPPAAWLRKEGSAVAFAATPDRSAVARGGDGLMRVELVMKADQVAEAARGESDFVVVLDRSGSMAGERLAQARGAIAALVEQLAPRDRFGLVVYDDEASVAIPLGFADPSAKSRWREQVADLDVGGSTNMSGGLDRGLELLTASQREGRAGRMLLLSDGHANKGDASPEGLRARGLRATQHEQVLSTVGIGEGFNEFSMSQLADAGTGNFHYLSESRQLSSILAQELSSARATVARSLRVRVTPGSDIQVVEAAGYPLTTAGDATSFQVGSLYSGQERRVWVTLRVPVDREADYALEQIRLDYVEADAPRQLEVAGLAVKCVTDEARALSSIDKVAWERAVTQEEWGRVRQEVAQQVHDGQREQAVATLRAYGAKQKAANAVVGSAAVSGTLAEVDALERNVDDAFVGGDQLAKQNAFSKQNVASGRGLRRAGSFFGRGNASNY